MIEITEGNKHKVANTQGWCSFCETVDASWVITREIGEQGDTWRREKSWLVMDCDPDSLWSAWKVRLCEGQALVRGTRP